MKSKSLLGLFLTCFPALLLAQVADLTAPPSQPRTTATPQAMAVVTGKVAGEGGFVDGKPRVILKCGEQVRADTTADSKGDFSLTVGVSDDLRTNAFAQRDGGVLRQGDWINCEVYGDLSGYSSEHIRLSDGQFSNIVQVGTIILHPLVQEGGSSISVISLAAPSKAKQDFTKGREQEKKGKWAAACDYFKKA